MESLPTEGSGNTVYGPRGAPVSPGEDLAALRQKGVSGLNLRPRGEQSGS